ncbi:MAG: hypothetical protein ACTSYB_03545 [Candidatus Helarchaeota archaeon]
MELVDEIAFGFWIVVIILFLSSALILLQKYIKSEERNKVKLAFCFMFLCLGLSRIFLVYFDYFLTELNPMVYENYQFMWKLANSFELAGLGFLIIVSEYAVFQGKDYYLFILGFTVVVIIGLLIPDFFLSQNVLVYAVAFAAFIPLSWIYLAIKLPPTRKNTILIFIGFVLFGIGLIFLSVAVVEAMAPIIDIHRLYLLSAILQIPGIIILAIGIKKMYFAR